MIITNLKQGVKNPNRVNVFVDGKFAFSLDVSQVVDYRLKVGQELAAEEIAELKKASEFGKLYQRALEWALTRPRSERELRDYLFRKLRASSSGKRDYSREKLRTSFEGHPQLLRGRSDEPREDGSEERPEKDRSKFFDEIVGRLVSKGYVDDRKFAEYYVENRFVKKGISRKRLKMELMKKGVAREIIDEVLNKRDDAEEIHKMIQKKRGKYSEERLAAYLVRQGFSYDQVRAAMKEYDD